MGKNDPQKKGPPTITNRKARHDYHIDDVVEAGISLQGTEVKSLRAGNASFTDAFAYLQHGEVFLKDFYIKEFEQGSYNNHDPRRLRKLLLQRKEIEKMDKWVRQKGMSLIPLKIYFKNGWAKVQIGYARGKKSYDKRDDIAKKDLQRDIDRQVKGQFKI